MELEREQIPRVNNSIGFIVQPANNSAAGNFKAKISHHQPLNRGNLGAPLGGKCYRTPEKMGGCSARARVRPKIPRAEE